MDYIKFLWDHVSDIISCLHTEFSKRVDAWASQRLNRRQDGYSSGRIAGCDDSDKTVITYYIEKKLFSCIYAARVAREILDMLPATDLVEELRELIDIQYDLLFAMVEDRAVDHEFIMEFLQQIDCLLSTLESVRHGKSVE